MKRLTALILTALLIIGIAPVYAQQEQIICTSISLTTPDGKDAATFSADSYITGKVSLKAPAASASAIVVMAAYNGATLIDVQTNYVTVSKSNTLKTENTIYIKNYPDATSIKLMVLSADDETLPLATPVTAVRQDVRPYVFGTLQSDTANYENNIKSGLNTALLELSWNSFYTSDGVKNTKYIEQKKSQLAKMRELGFKVMLGLGTQYSPQWIYNLPNSRYVNQYGDSYTTTEIGDTAVNGVFNQQIRNKLEEYVIDVFAELGTDFEIVRLGWMRYGEIGFPNQTFNGNSNSYWCYDSIAQGNSTGLPEGISACPTPNWKPGDKSPNGEANAFAQWYMDALLNYQTWQIDTVSKYCDSELAILYPSWGMRTGQLESAIAGNLSASTSAEKNGEVQRGFDFERLIMGIKNKNVIVYCTWIDANPEWTYKDDEELPTESNNFSPVHFMAYYAKKNPLKLKIMGENTGGGGISAMELTFERMKKYDLDGVMWAMENDLYDSVAPTLEDYIRFIEEYKNR